MRARSNTTPQILQCHMHWCGKLAVVNLLCFASLGLNINGAWAQTGTASVYGEVTDPQRDEHTEV
jgi:hypothetical protein